MPIPGATRDIATMGRLLIAAATPTAENEELPGGNRPLSWAAWCEILLIVALASGASAGLVLGIDRAWHTVDP